MRLAVWVVLLLGCSARRSAPSHVITCNNDILIGDASYPPEAIPETSDGLAQVQVLDDGSMVPLVAPPQGGYVSYTTARVRNIHRCVWLRGRLVDPDTGAEIGSDARTVALTVGADGWGHSDPAQNAQFANIPACPDYDIENVQGRTLVLEVIAVDGMGAQAVATRKVVPSCMQQDPVDRARCVCSCTARFSPGRCPTDGGAAEPSD
jgi:hypothetical protein